MLLECQEKVPERGLCVGNTYFKHRGLRKYTRVKRGRDGVEMKSMIDLVLVKRDILQYVQDVRAVRGIGPPCCTV